MEKKVRHGDPAATMPEVGKFGLYTTIEQGEDTILVHPADLPALIAALQEIEREVKGE